MKKQCKSPAVYRYTWPGNDESFVCNDCSKKLTAVAGAMGLYLQLIELGNADLRCRQIKKN